MVYLAHIIVKSAQFGQFGCFSFENGILISGKLGKKNWFRGPAGTSTCNFGESNPLGLTDKQTDR